MKKIFIPIVITLGLLVLSTCVSYKTNSEPIDQFSPAFWEQANVEQVNAGIKNAYINVTEHSQKKIERLYPLFRGQNLPDNLTVLMLAAAYTKDPHVLTALVSAGAQVNERDAEGNTPLMYALQYSQYAQNSIILLVLGSKAEDTNKYSYTALMIVGFNKRMESSERKQVIHALLAAGARVDSRDKDMMTPLMYNLTDKIDVDSVTELISAGARVNARAKGDVTPLMAAALYGAHPEVISALIKAGAKVGAKNKGGSTVLVYVVMNDRNPEYTNEILQILIKAGAQIDERDEDGETLLMKAAYFALDPEVINTLIAAGAKINDRNNRNMTALAGLIDNLANDSDRDKHLLVLAALLKAGANVNERYNRNWTPLLRAAWQRMDEKLLTLLLDAGAHLEDRDDDGNTAFLIASQFSYDAVTALKNAGAKVDVINNDGRNALILAAYLQEDTRAFSPLLQLGLDINKGDKYGKTALMYAGCLNTMEPESREEIINILLAAGAKPEIKSNEGKTAADYKNTKCVSENDPLAWADSIAPRR